MSITEMEEKIAQASQPKCSFCKQPYRPPVGVPTAFAYCKRPECSAERRRRAAEHFGTGGPIQPHELTGRYLVRRRADNEDHR